MFVCSFVVVGGCCYNFFMKWYSLLFRHQPEGWHKNQIVMLFWTFLLVCFSMWWWSHCFLWQHKLTWLPWQLPTWQGLLLESGSGTCSSYYLCIWYFKYRTTPRLQLWLLRGRDCIILHCFTNKRNYFLWNPFKWECLGLIQMKNWNLSLINFLLFSFWTLIIVFFFFVAMGAVLMW